MIVAAELAKVYDSRGNPTVKAIILAEDGLHGMASCPSGASTGTYEVRAFPEGSVDMGIRKAHELVLEELKGMELGEQADFDKALKDLDGTDGFSAIGGNTAVALSIAYARASAAVAGVELWEYVQSTMKIKGHSVPAIVGNVMNGGVHAIGGPDIQEFIAFVRGHDPRSEVEAAIAVHREVGRGLRSLLPGSPLGRGDEGGWVASLNSEKALDILSDACAKVTDAMRDRGVSAKPGLDLAASEIYKDGNYVYADRKLSRDGQLDFVSGLIDKYDLAYVEDPFDEEDYESFGKLTQRSGSGRLIVGDDIYTTSPARLERGVKENTTNAVLIKVNQVGTLSTTIETVKMARAAGWDTITSHRSGETTDDWLSHLAVAFGSAGIKCGVLGGERVAKLNELIRIGGGD